jgi:shikimate dehydrogenase
MNKEKNTQFGLIGFPLNNSFSVDYFTKKFEENVLPCAYKNYPIADISTLPAFIENTLNLSGLNVTKPYKTAVIPYLDELATSAQKCGAVNCIQFTQTGKKIGHNTDVFGFQHSLLNFLGSNQNLRAMVFGNGGAAEAVLDVLNTLHIDYIQVIRGKINHNKQINYQQLEASHYKDHQLLINTTSVGMFPQVKECLNLDFAEIGSNHYCYDLIYLPERTIFLEQAAAQGAKIKNGLEMLHLQADAAYDIWMNSES